MSAIDLPPCAIKIPYQKCVDNSKPQRWAPFTMNTFSMKPRLECTILVVLWSHHVIILLIMWTPTECMHIVSIVQKGDMDTEIIRFWHSVDPIPKCAHKSFHRWGEHIYLPSIIPYIPVFYFNDLNEIFWLRECTCVLIHASTIVSTYELQHRLNVASLSLENFSAKVWSLLLWERIDFNVKEKES